MTDVTRIEPFSFGMDPNSGIITPCDNLIQRRLSHMTGMFLDQNAAESVLAKEDTLLYEVYEVRVPDEEGHLMICSSIIYPGKVGYEYFMTKGHFHQNIASAETYHCLRGRGYMLMESDQGAWRAESMAPGRVIYVPPYFAHRSINTGDEPMISFCVYPGGAGHDYGSIEKRGFRKVIIERDQQATVVDNPKWKGKTC